MSMKTDKPQTPAAPKPGPSLAARVQDAVVLAGHIQAWANDPNADKEPPVIDTYLAGVEATCKSLAALEAQVDSYQYVMDHLQTTAQGLVERADRLMQEAGALEYLVGRMAKAIVAGLKDLKVDKASGATWEFELQLQKRIKVVDLQEFIAKADARYVVQRPQYDPAVVQRLLEDGVSVPGMTLEEVHSLGASVKKTADALAALMSSSRQGTRS